MAEVDDFQVGETVMLKSGGPKMTVAKPATFEAIRAEIFPENKEVPCQWFTDGNLRQGSFHPDQLKKVTSDK